MQMTFKNRKALFLSPSNKIDDEPAHSSALDCHFVVAKFELLASRKPSFHQSSFLMTASFFPRCRVVAAGVSVLDDEAIAGGSLDGLDVSPDTAAAASFGSLVNRTTHAAININTTPKLMG